MTYLLGHMIKHTFPICGFLQVTPTESSKVLNFVYQDFLPCLQCRHLPEKNAGTNSAKIRLDCNVTKVQFEC